MEEIETPSEKWQRWFRRYLHPDPMPARVVALDVLLVTGILVAINLVFDRANFGWVGLNPSPYFLVPLLLGARYGFLPGVAGGITVVGTIALGRTLGGLDTLPGFLYHHQYLLASLLVSGAVVGEIQRYLAIRIEQQNVLLKDKNTRLNELDEEAFLLREAKDELERIISTMNADLSTLDMEIRRLYQCKNEDVYPNLLNLLSRKARLQQGAFYLVQDNETLFRIEYTGTEEGLPPTLELRSSRILKYAVENQEVTVLPQLWNEEQEHTDDYLMVVPLLAGEGQVYCVLVVQQLPMVHFNRRTVQSIDLICRWGVRLISGRIGAQGDFRFTGNTGSQKIYSVAHLRNALKLAYESFYVLHLSSSLVLIYDPEAPEDMQEKLEEIVMPVLRHADVPSRLHGKVPHLAVFLPLTSERGAVLCRERVLSMCAPKAEGLLKLRGEIMLFERYKDLQGFLDDLQEKITP